MAKRQLTHEDVWSLYRLLLGREPESYEIVIQAVNDFRFAADYVDNIIESEEFKLKRAERQKMKH